MSMSNIVITVTAVILVAALVKGVLAVYAPRAYAVVEAADTRFRDGRNAVAKLGVGLLLRLFRR